MSEFLLPLWPYLFEAGWIGLSLFAAGHAIMFKRDPRSAAIWVFICLLLPFVGPWLYWVLGINRVERRAVRKLGRRGHPFEPDQLEQEHRRADPHHEAIGHLTRLRSVADHVTRLPMLPGNQIIPLHNGEEAYPRMLEAIENARRSVTLATYIFRWDDVGHQFVDALGKAADRGVRVHVLLDGIGALGSFSRMGRRLLKTGAEVASFFPLRFPLGRLRINLRNHRKILVADGRVGFTGGMNISADHLLSRQEPNSEEDLHFELTGPLVAEMQHTFVEDWSMATSQTLEGSDYFPNLKPTGKALCRGIPSGPDENFEIVHWILQAAFAAAEHSVQIATPYFVPTAPLLSAMSMAAMRGVDVKLFLPSTVDHRFMKWAADAFLWQLLERGIKVYRREGPFVHTKLMIVDQRWILLGSANLDRRSFRLNFEFNVEAYDTVLATELSEWLEGLVPFSVPVTLEEVDSRPKWKRLRDGFVKLFSPHL
jgi:cardiolipin synthase A/B